VRGEGKWKGRKKCLVKKKFKIASRLSSLTNEDVVSHDMIHVIVNKEPLPLFRNLLLILFFNITHYQKLTMRLLSIIITSQIIGN